jgi:hypothetical protein
MTADWRKLHDEELHSLYSSRNIIKAMKSRKVSWAEQVEPMERYEIHKQLWLVSIRERDHSKDIGVDDG